MARPEDDRQRLLYILATECGIANAVIEYLTKPGGPECESPGDLAELYRSRELFSQGMISDVLPNVPDPPAQNSWPYMKLLGRLMQAYDLCARDHAGRADYKLQCHRCGAEADAQHGYWTCPKLIRP